MTNRRVRTFISSTITDLAVARERIDRSLTELEVFEVIRSETLPAMEDASRRVCLEEVRAADVVVLLVGSTYGYVPPQNNAEGLSVTHLEIREARRAGVPLFAFPRQIEAERDKRLDQLIAEIEDFDAGVFRKTWTSAEEVATEVRRSLLFWLTRRLREGHKVPAEEAAVRRAVGQASATVHMEIRSRLKEHEWRDWLAEQVAKVQQKARQVLLPEPKLAREDQRDRPRITVDIVAATPDRCDVQIHVTVPSLVAAENDPRTRQDTPHLSIPLNRGPSGEARFATAVLSFIRWMSEDPDGAAATLSDLAGSSRLPRLTRANLLALGMWMSSGHGQIVALAERMLSLNALDEHAFVLASKALFLFQAGELVVAGSPRSRLSRRITAVGIKLCEAALRTRVAGTEAIYTLAKHVAFPRPRSALVLLHHLREIEPDYDRRWYWHRDVGQIHYEAARLKRAAEHYDRGCELKPINGQLWRWAGDAYYGLGWWARALERYEMALAEDPYEIYFLKEKLAFCRNAIRTRRPRRSRFRERLATLLSSVSTPALQRWPRSRFGRRLAELAASLDPLNRDCREMLALTRNRQGQYDAAIDWLKESLACQPERAMTRLNLCANLLFRAGGRWTEEATWQARAAVALRGVSAGSKLRLLLTNTSTREELMATFEETVVPAARGDWEAHIDLRKNILAPEQFGTVLHVEGPDQLPPA